MKSILTLFIVGTLSVTGRAGTDAVLRGIRIVETQDQLHPPRGKLGERGPYQFRRETWKMHTSSSFALAENREVANVVAHRHYAWIESQLESGGLRATPYNVALAWNAGVNAVIRGSVPAVSYDYARRVMNIAESFVVEKPQPAWTPPVVSTEEPASKPNQQKEVIPAEASPVVVEVALAPAEATATAQDDAVSIRFYSDPILLALNRSVPTATEQPSVALAAQVPTESLRVAGARL